MVHCSNCDKEITGNYCAECGQRYTGRKLTFGVLISDYFNAFFSLDRSFLSNLQIGFTNPRKLVTNYWNGYRSFYFSPNKFLAFAVLFLGINFLITKDKFLDLTFDLENISGQVTLLVLMIPLLTLSSYLTYFSFRRSIYEHLALNTYTSSFWLILFSLPSILLDLLNILDLQGSLFLCFLVLTLFWNARVLALTTKGKILRTLLNLALFFAFTAGVAYLFS